MTKEPKKKVSRTQVFLLRLLCAMATGFATAFGVAAGRDAYTKLTKKPGKLVPIRGGRNAVI